MRRPRAILVLALLLGVPSLSLSYQPAHAQDEPACSPDAGTVITRQIDSGALGREKSYAVYLPPDWCALEDLPLLVMLHGLGGNHFDWTSYGKLDATADQLIAAGEIEPLVILMPDGEKSFYLNGATGDFETYIVEEHGEGGVGWRRLPHRGHAASVRSSRGEHGRAIGAVVPSGLK